MVNFKDDKNQHKLKQKLTVFLSEGMEEVLKKSQTELKGAPYPLSVYARRYFATIKEYQAFNWPQAFIEADITVKSKIDIVDYGKQTTKIKKMEE